MAAAEKLRGKREIELTVIDQKTVGDFLPLLPDVIGRGIRPQLLSLPIKEEAAKRGFVFIQEEVLRLDLAGKKVFTGRQELSYDYLLIAGGSQTNFYSNRQVESHALKLDSADDALKIKAALARDDFSVCVVSGAGYTGIEVAANLRRFFIKSGVAKRVILVERAPDILGPLPEWMKHYVRANLKELNIGILINTSIEEAGPHRLKFSTGEILEGALLIWTAGVKTPDFIQGLQVEKNAQGRVKVDEYLKINESCFVAGDAAYFVRDGNFLRMAAQFSIMEAQTAAENIIRSIQGRPLKKYRPRDLGYVIPMANNRSCGRVFGLDLKGVLPTLLHFMVCLYRLRGARNKTGLAADLLKGGW